ncbi:peptidase family M48-domain-containing protein [Flagelloscypha sp. PMI_526]|nr:peptidase family M48-domain-containing protein [Flagelloscypha sp. PMI_526]
MNVYNSACLLRASSERSSKTMDLLNSGLDAVQRQLAFVATDSIDWKHTVLTFSWGICLFESYLILRQYPLYGYSKPPPVLEPYFDQDIFQKSQAYGRDKATFALFSGVYRQLLDTLLLQYDFYAWCWVSAGWVCSLAGYGSEYEILQSIIFVDIIFVGSAIPTIPLSVYQTFVLEEKHGFNKTTPTLFVTDLLKGWTLGFFLGAPFIGAFLWIFKWAGNRFVPWLMMFMLSFQLIMVLIYPTLIQPLFNKLSPLPEGNLRNRVTSLAARLKFPLKHLYEIDGSKRSSHSNAYFFGLPWSKHIVIFDTLIEQSQPAEVEAVLAHELGHWAYAHPTQMLLISQFHVFTILALFPAFLHAPPFLKSFGFSKEVSAQPPTMVAFLLFQLLLTPLESVIGIIMNAISRHFEYQADKFACTLHEQLAPKAESLKDKQEIKEMSDLGERLGKALITLHVKNLSTVWVDWLYSAYHHSHPTLTERLKELEAYKESIKEKQAKQE